MLCTRPEHRQAKEPPVVLYDSQNALRAFLGLSPLVVCSPVSTQPSLILVKMQSVALPPSVHHPLKTPGAHAATGAEPTVVLI